MSIGLIGLNRNVWQKAFILGKRGALLPRSGTAFARNHNNLYQMILSENAEVLRAKQFTCAAAGGGGGGSSGAGAIGQSSLASGGGAGGAGSRPPSGGGSRGASGSGSGGDGKGKGGKDGVCFPAEPAMPKEIDLDNMPTRCPPKSEQKKPAAKPVVKRPQDSCLASKASKVHPLCQKGGGKGKGDCDNQMDWWKLLAALLAGLGLGGLLFWLLSGKGDKSKKGADGKLKGGAGAPVE